MSFGLSPLEFREGVRLGKHKGNTSGFCPGYVQGNVVILPSDWAAEFLQFCQFNQKPCPLVGMSEIGVPILPILGEGIDIRTDLPRYRIFKDGIVVDELSDITDCWRDDFVTFVLGCSFSFEEALIADGLEVRNVIEGVNVPMYRTNIPCRSAGRFSGNMVVSMRPFLAADAIRAVQISTRFPSVHGAPVHLGDPTRIGVQDISNPDFGDAVTIEEGEIPVFWACGVTPQVALEQAKPPVCITHSPGCMLVTDLRNSQLAVL